MGAARVTAAAWKNEIQEEEIQEEREEEEVGIKCINRELTNEKRRERDRERKRNEWR